nr:NlpC/P60 family protein [Amycolatopsis suaedae]
MGVAPAALAVPPPPPNPSDADINAGRAAVNGRAGEVGALTNQLAQAEARLTELQADVEVKMEEANKALVDLQTAQDAAAQAERDAEAARAQSEAAGRAITEAQARVDRFIAGSYRQGSTIGSMSAYIGADSPKDLLARAQLLDSVSGTQINALEGMRRAQAEKANADAAARRSLQIAQQRQAEAVAAKSTADTAQAEAVSAQQNQAGTAARLEAEKTTVERRLFEAQNHVRGLEGQRTRYEQWKAQKAAEEEEAARRAAAQAQASGGDSAPSRPSGRPANRPSAPAGASVEAVIARAMSQLGVVYAWGGGNQSGPTRGIRDGGVADAHGDYRKIGFDCSGLMIYAFAGVKGLPHYSGYQYNAGRKVPLSQMRRGDMLFWGRGGRIHHVALYLGNGQMVEAPHSGSRVKVSPVRYGGIMPYATRLIG